MNLSNTELGNYLRRVSEVALGRKTKLIVNERTSEEKIKVVWGLCIKKLRKTSTLNKHLS